MSKFTSDEFRQMVAEATELRDVDFFEQNLTMLIGRLEYFEKNHSQEIDQLKNQYKKQLEQEIESFQSQLEMINGQLKLSAFAGEVWPTICSQMIEMKKAIKSLKQQNQVVKSFVNQQSSVDIGTFVQQISTLYMKLFQKTKSSFDAEILENQQRYQNLLNQFNQLKAENECEKKLDINNIQELELPVVEDSILQNLHSTISELTSSIAKLQIDNQNLKEQNDLITLQMKQQLTSDQQKYYEQLRQLSVDISQVSKMISVDRQSFEQSFKMLSINADCTKCLDCIDPFLSNINALKQKICAFGFEYEQENLKQQLTDLKRQFKTNEEFCIFTIEQQFLAKYSGLYQSYVNNQQEILQLSEENNALRSRQEQNESSHVLNTSQSANLIQLQQSYDEIQSKYHEAMESYGQLLTTSDSQNSQLQIKNKQLSDSFDTTQLRVTELQSLLEMKENQFRELQQQLLELSNDNHSSQRELQELHLLNNELCEKNDQMIIEIEQNSLKLQDNIRNTTTIQEANKQLENELQILRQQLKDSNKQVGQLIEQNQIKMKQLNESLSDNAPAVNESVVGDLIQQQNEIVEELQLKQTQYLDQILNLTNQLRQLQQINNDRDDIIASLEEEKLSIINKFELLIQDKQNEVISESSLKLQAIADLTSFKQMIQEEKRAKLVRQQSDIQIISDKSAEADFFKQQWKETQIENSIINFQSKYPLFIFDKTDKVDLDLGQIFIRKNTVSYQLDIFYFLNDKHISDIDQFFLKNNSSNLIHLHHKQENKQYLKITISLPDVMQLIYNQQQLSFEVLGKKGNKQSTIMYVSLLYSVGGILFSSEQIQYKAHKITEQQFMSEQEITTTLFQQLLMNITQNYNQSVYTINQIFNKSQPIFEFEVLQQIARIPLMIKIDSKLFGQIQRQYKEINYHQTLQQELIQEESYQIFKFGLNLLLCFNKIDQSTMEQLNFDYFGQILFDDYYFDFRDICVEFLQLALM